METIMTKQPPMLEERIDVALQPEAAVTSADLAALIEEAETKIAKADQLWTIDPTLSPDPKAARQMIMDTTLAADRLRPLLPKLQARYEQVHEQEQAAWWAEREAVWLTEYDALKRERDALAEELREVYPDAATKIADLFARIAVNNEALAELHRSRPAGVDQHLLLAELHARGLDYFTYDAPSLLTMHLFDWDTGRKIWPPPPPSLAAACAATAMPSYDRRFTADWAKENERRAAAQRVEQQRMYYARLTQEQEDRENAEARERFLAQQQRLTVNRPPRP
jgi:hypothetical protein